MKTSIDVQWAFSVNPSIDIFSRHLFSLFRLSYPPRPVFLSCIFSTLTVLNIEQNVYCEGYYKRRVRCTSLLISLGHI
jgi:hypothetical protein